MANIYYPEEVLIDKLQSGEFTYRDYILHHSSEWAQQYKDFCEARNLEQDDRSALDFLDYKEDELTQAIDRGEI